jgi:hypothetical protein
MKFLKGVSATLVAYNQEQTMTQKLDTESEAQRTVPTEPLKKHGDKMEVEIRWLEKEDGSSPTGGVGECNHAARTRETGRHRRPIALAKSQADYRN